MSRSAHVPKALTAAAAVIVALPLAVVVMTAASPATPAQAGYDAGLGGSPTALARRDIPADYLTWYMNAAQTCPGLPWAVLAGIGKAETDHGRSPLPGTHSGHNSAGAEGPMQFLPATFARFAVNADPSQPLTPYDPADAIYTAARMLCANGARGGTSNGIEQAIFAYNHASWYVTDVLSWATRYAAPPTSGTAATAISFAEAQLGKPYCWGGQGPACFDCSGLVFAAYAAAGLHIARTTYQWQQDGPQIPLTQIQPGDLLFSPGSDGTVANPGHVVMYLGHGKVIQAPQTGEDVQFDPVDLADTVVATRPSVLGHP
jgi:cell wall-associated NlpC family hydrolase